MVLTDDYPFKPRLVNPTFGRRRLDIIVTPILFTGNYERAMPPERAFLDEASGNRGNEQENLVAGV
jgi:hypothetical protein